MLSAVSSIKPVPKGQRTHLPVTKARRAALIKRGIKKPKRQPAKQRDVPKPVLDTQQPILFVKKRMNSTKADPQPLAPVNAAGFLPGNVSAVVNLIKRGFSIQDVCEVFRVPPSLLVKWKKMYPSFRAELQEARLDADGLVIRSLHKRAVGYTYKEQSATKTGVVTLKKHMPADVSAQKYWLGNRPNTRDNWQDRRALDVDARVQVEDRREAIDAVVELLRAPGAVSLDKSGTAALEHAPATEAPDTATARDDDAAPPTADALAELAR